MPSCSCGGDRDGVGGFFFLPNAVWTLDEIHRCSDLVISLAFFSIPLEFLYFLTSPSSYLFPYSRFLTPFAPFIIFYGLTHFVSAFTHSSSSFHLMLALTLLKIFTAWLSCTSAIGLGKLIPEILRFMDRKGGLLKKAEKLLREIGSKRRQEEASWLVVMLSREIRKSLDRRTILRTCVTELSRALSLGNCAIWLPDESNSAMVLTHESRRGSYDESACVPIDDPVMAEILARRGIGILGLYSKLGNGAAPAVAIRLPMLRLSAFGEAGRVEPCNGVLVLVLPEDGNRSWGSTELEIVEGVADQLAVALSHAAIIEDSLLVREKLMDQNIALQSDYELAVKAREAKCLFWAAMSTELIKSSRSIAAIMSVVQIENWVSEEQRRTVDAMAKVSLLLPGLIENLTGLADSRIELRPCAFSLDSMLKEVASVSKLICAIRGLNFEIRVRGKVPGQFFGDQMRIVQAILFMVLKMLGCKNCGTVCLSVAVENGPQGCSDPSYKKWKQYVFEGSGFLKFDIYGDNLNNKYRCSLHNNYEKSSNNEDGYLSVGFSFCQKLAKLIHGSASIGHNWEGLDRSHRTPKLTMRLPLQHPAGGLVQPTFMDPKPVQSLLKRMRTILAGSDGFNRYVTRKLLENMGCHLTTVSSWHRCMETLHSSKNHCHLLLIDEGFFEKNSNETIGQIRKLRSNSWLRVVVLTSRFDSGVRNRCIQYGFHGVISKPVIMQEMEDELQRLFNHASASVCSSSFLQRTEGRTKGTPEWSTAEIERRGC